MRRVRTVFWLMGFFSTTVLAADMKPGLWETHIYQRSESGLVELGSQRMVQSLNALPPDVVKRMNAAGLDWNKDFIRTRVCLTSELKRIQKEAQSEKDSLSEGAVNCQTLSESRTTTEHQRVVLCEAPLLEHQEIWRLERSTGQLVGATLISWHQEVMDGRTDIRQIEIRSRFVSATCGKVRPLSAEQFRKGLR